jgi:hypothetical protein
VARQYEKEVLKSTDNSSELELIYDNMMEVLIEVKKVLNEQD